MRVNPADETTSLMRISGTGATRQRPTTSEREQGVQSSVEKQCTRYSLARRFSIIRSLTTRAGRPNA